MPAPANDDFANAIAITLDPDTHPDETVTGNNTDATQESVDECYWGIGQTVWWKWTATDNCRVKLNHSGSSTNAVVAVFTGTGPDCDDLTWIADAYRDENPLFDDPRFSFDAVAGTTYYFQGDTWPSGDATFDIDLHALDPSVPPANDAIANAIPIVGSASVREGITDSYSIDGATLEAGETSIAGSSHDNLQVKTLWWKWVADNSGTNSFFSFEENFNFNNRVIVYLSPDGSTDFSQFIEKAYGASGFATLFFAEYGQTYYIQIGAPSGGSFGDVYVDWTLDSYEYHVGTCPTFVSMFDTNDNVNFTGGGTELFMPAVEPGMLLLLITNSLYDDVGLGPPPGWNTLFDEQWASIPFSTGVNPGQTPFTTPHSNIAAFWKIADGSEPAEDEVLITLSPFHGTEGGVVMSYACYEVGTFNRVDFPDPPIKYFGINSTNPILIDDQTEASPGSSFGVNVNYPLAIADWIGNHVYFAVTQLKGYSEEFWYTSDDTIGANAETLPDPHEDVAMLHVSPVGPGSAPIGGSGIFPRDGAGVWLFSTGDSVFWDINVNNVDNDPCFEVLTKMADSFSPGSHDIFPQFFAWGDGNIGVEHVNFEVWAVRNGLAALSFLIQAPESFRPTNDTAATAMTIPSCPAVIVECIFAAQSEGGPQIEGQDPCMDVWFRFPAGATEDVLISTRESDYDTILAVYDSNMNLIDSNDDIDPLPPPFNLQSEVLLSAVAGQTYYIQVISDDIDATTLRLSVDCSALAVLDAYWGINSKVAGSLV